VLGTGVSSGSPHTVSPRTIVVSLTDRGAALAHRLPWEHHQGDLAATVRESWPVVGRLVLVCATGIAVRVVGPLLAGKDADPAVVCVDDAGRWAVALAGGHRGANDLAREVAALLDADAVVSTATEAAGLPGLDTLLGFTARGDVAGVTRAWLDGTPPTLDAGDLPGWPVPAALGSLALAAGPAADRPVVRVTDRSDSSAGPAQPKKGVVVLCPRTLVVGVGASSGADPEGLAELVDEALTRAGLAEDAVGAVATIDLKAGEPAINALARRFGVALATHAAERLAAVPVPNPSEVVAAAVGTASVCEAAALLAAGPGAELVVAKRRSDDATVAVARRHRPEGHLAVVGLGPGDASLRTPAASAAVRHADAVIGYGPYVDQCRDLLGPHQEVVRSTLGAEAERCAEALRRAAAGRRVALVCSGDAGVYAMAPLVHELATEHGDPPITVVPGVTAALAAAAVLGSPLGHDHAAVSLSDLLTPWPEIERRLHAVAEGDFVVSLYNPRSRRRTSQLGRALEILAAHRPRGCPTAVVADAGRPGQRVVRSTLDTLDPEAVDMVSLVVVGASATRWIGDRMVTPRGYGPAPAASLTDAATASGVPSP
jgi:cobalt-precorrin 5A hydrolase/precorrin-3B C17-methyltransferase